MEIELEEVERQLRSAKGVPSADKLIKYLRLVRDLHIRDSPMVARYGNILLRHYKSDLSEDERGRVALERTRGNTTAAIDALRKYLEVFANDKDAWEELAELYLEVLNYRQAAFCYEELIMHAPSNSSFFVRYADILYTLGGTTNYKTARAYYAKAIELTAGGSLRGLFGILACSAHIPDRVSLQDARSRAQIELPEVTAQALLRIYKQHAPDKLPFVEPMLAKLNGQGGMLE
ncbi:ER membrane protein complex subunit 2 [Tetrabaena socialis]|uniref:ER membrane protein complex subunit 2 n=1 Tax=Tetrabaena socialis TaxID=47790 RepID=A0A2J8A1G7_9CHLO|nr:ER membrane protein complex subunit 2 [Tetrabaena socialis]|eukprot:PNH06369.1 ER membrane protein complex subunit 2 [Tetrabaena socialis]